MTRMLLQHVERPCRAFASSIGPARGDGERDPPGGRVDAETQGGCIGCACFHAIAWAIAGDHGAQSWGAVWGRDATVKVMAGS
jgi:hypothetical protein